MSSEFIPAKPGAGGSSQQDAGTGTSAATTTPPRNRATGNPADASAPAAAQTVAKAATNILWSAPPSIEQKPAEATYKCPKCGTQAREVARFCRRCHNTLRFECPSCGNRQRSGGKCEKCGIDFIKYIGAVVAGKKAEADAVHDRLESRSSFLRALLLLPVNGGISLLRHFFKRDPS